jgi:class 3 adenylate cyclase
MEWRIGIHLGDVLVEGDDIFGDGVNIAARLEGIAAPGGISASFQVTSSSVGSSSGMLHRTWTVLPLSP